MRNFLKLILLGLAVSQFGAANQDSLKKISFQSEWRNRYTDRTGDDANKIKDLKAQIETEAVLETQLQGR